MVLDRVVEISVVKSAGASIVASTSAYRFFHDRMLTWT